MKVAYLMPVHRDPHVLKRAIAVLSAENCTFFIHVDQKADAREFTCIEAENVFFSKRRFPVYWAEFSQVQATILLMRQAMEHPGSCDRLVLLTGSTFPLRSGVYVKTFFEENHDLEFISTVRMPAPGKPISRISTKRFPSEKPARRLAGRALAKIGLARRDYVRSLGGLRPYSGGGSWALSRDACEYVLDFLTRNPGVEKYFQNTFAPDEVLFHTVLGNSPLLPRLRRDLLYDDWCVSGPHPGMIDSGHIAFFESRGRVLVDDMYGVGEALFARKFSDARLDLVDRVESMIVRKESGALASGGAVGCKVLAENG